MLVSPFVLNRQQDSLHHCPGHNSLRYCLLPPISAKPSPCVLHWRGWSWWLCLWRCLKPKTKTSRWNILKIFLLPAFVCSLYLCPIQIIKLRNIMLSFAFFWHCRKWEPGHQIHCFSPFFHKLKRQFKTVKSNTKPV